MALIDQGIDLRSGLAVVERVALTPLVNKFTDTPFTKQANVVRVRLLELTGSQGLVRDGRPMDPDQAIDFELLSMCARLVGDPGSKVADDCRAGVRIGFQTTLDRCPPVWPAKSHWRSGLEDLGDPCYENYNYSTMPHNETTLAAEFDEQMKTGMMLATTFGEARKRWGTRWRIASRAVISEGGGEGNP